jgi:GT2 family glycosyltransferase
MNLAIVILNWNGKHLLEKFLPQLLEKSKNQGKTYVIDNNSTDESVQYIKSNFNNVTIIKNYKNLGYAGGYNKGLKKIEADLYCLINNDIEVSTGWLSPVINEFKTNPLTKIVQPKILNYTKKSYFDYSGAAGGFIDYLGYPYCDGRVHDKIQKDDGQYDFNKKIFWASGACFFIRQETFEKHLGFDERFFAHMEEIDLCWRVNNSGGTIKYIYESTVFHVGGATLNSNNPKKTFLNFRNSLLMLDKNLTKNKYTVLILRMIFDGLIGIYFLFSFKLSHIIAIIKAHLAFYFRKQKLFNVKNQKTVKIKYYNTRFIFLDYIKEKYLSFFVN